MREGKAISLAWRCALGLMLLLVSGAEALGQVSSKEYELKAVLLWRLAQYVEFPPDALGSAQDPLVIGVLGENPFGRALETAVRGEAVQGRKVEVHAFKGVGEIGACHLLYISASERPRLRQIIRELKNRSILTVSDIEGFARTEGGMVRFAMEQGKIGLVINLEAVTAANLKLDGRVLRMAQIVK